MLVPLIDAITSFKPPASLLEIDINSNVHFFLWLTFSYILKRSEANKLASSPPVPALISMIAFFLSASSFGSKNNFNFFSFISNSVFNSDNSSSAMSFNSLSAKLSFKIFSKSFLSSSYDKYFLAFIIISLRSEYSFDFSANSFLSISPEDRSFSKVECFNMSSSIVFAGIIIFFLLQLLHYQLFHLFILSYFVHQKDKAYCFLFHHL